MIRTLTALAILTATTVGQERPRLPEEMLARGSEALAAARLDDAERVLAAAAAYAPDIRLEILRAEVMIARKDAAGAAASIARAIASLKPGGDPARAAHRTHARALVEAGSYPQAAAAVLLSLGLDAAAAPALAIASRGFAEAGDRRTARALLGVAVHLDPKRADLLKARAALSLADGDPYDALRDAETVLQQAPADADARRLRAQALHALGRTLEARDALAALARAVPLEPPLARALAALDLEAGLIDDAAAVLRKLGPLAPSDAAAIARAWLDRGRAREALGVLGAASAPGDAPDLIRLRALAHLEMGEPARAAEILRTMRSAAREDQIAIARAERMAGNRAGAAAILEPMLENDPGDLAAREELIVVRRLEGDAAAARRLLAEGLALSAHHPAFVRALEELVPEISPTGGAEVVAALHGGSLSVDGAMIDRETAVAARQLRERRTASGSVSPTVRLVLDGAVEARAVQRAFDLLVAAGFTRISVEAK